MEIIIPPKEVLRPHLGWHKEVAFPLVWKILDKEGNINTKRSELFNRFLVLFDDRKIVIAT